MTVARALDKCGSEMVRLRGPGWWPIRGVSADSRVPEEEDGAWTSEKNTKTHSPLFAPKGILEKNSLHFCLIKEKQCAGIQDKEVKEAERDAS